ncbi:MAG: hypothetical protein FIB08_03750 [Candidatus Methanoperedens sp.]|nr:hypothetical protein [Candidatus Methanoperedens sp.]
MAEEHSNFLFGFAAMIFAGYPMVKDIINRQPGDNAITSAIGTILFAVGITLGFILMFDLRNKADEIKK